MDKDARDELRKGFELQLRHIFYSKPEFPYLPSMVCYHVFFPVKNEEHDFGFLVLEWECYLGQMWNWTSTWVDTEEELRSYKYKRESSDKIVDLVKIAKIFAKNMARVHHKHMMRQKEEQKDDWESWSQFHKSTPKPFLN